MRGRHRRIQKRNKKLRAFWRQVDRVYAIPPEKQPLMQAFESWSDLDGMVIDRVEWPHVKMALKKWPTVSWPWPPLPT